MTFNGDCTISYVRDGPKLQLAGKMHGIEA